MDYRKTVMKAITAPNRNSHPKTDCPPKGELQASYSILCPPILQIILSEHFQCNAL